MLAFFFSNTPLYYLYWEGISSWYDPTSSVGKNMDQEHISFPCNTHDNLCSYKQWLGTFGSKLCSTKVLFMLEVLHASIFIFVFKCTMYIVINFSTHVGSKTLHFEAMFQCFKMKTPCISIHLWIMQKNPR